MNFDASKFITVLLHTTDLQIIELFGKDVKMEPLEAYPITYGILGLLALWGPMSGYDLKHVCDQVLTPMWGAAQSQIYKELRRMKALGWVEMEREEQESRPDLNLRRPTHEGEFYCP